VNKIQKTISLCGVFIILLMVLFPPSVTYSVYGGSLRPTRPGSGLPEGAHLVSGYEYKFITEATIDAPVLIAQIVAVLAITGLLLLLFHDKSPIK
jgi:hypothetical protein